MTVSKKDEEEFYNLLGTNNDGRLYDINNKLYKENPTISNDCSKVGSYPFIPMSLPNIMRSFIAIKKWIKKQNRYYTKATESNKKSSFLDAGSGIGNILEAAKAAKLAKHFTGIEFNEPTHKTAKKFLNNEDKDFSLLLDDILTYDNYSAFDIIYYYSPLRIGMLETYFEELVEDDASIGTIIIPKMKMGAQIRKDKRFKRICLSVRYYRYDQDTPVDFYIKTESGERKKSDLPDILRSRGWPPDFLNVLELKRLPSDKMDKDKLALMKRYVKERTS